MQVTTGRLLLLISVVALFLGVRQMFVSLDLFLFSIYLVPLLFAVVCSAIVGFDLRREPVERSMWIGALVGLISGAISMAVLLAEFAVRTPVGDWQLLIAVLVTAVSYELILTAIIGAAVAWGVRRLLPTNRN